MIRLLLLAALLSARTVSFDYAACDFFVEGTIDEAQVCAGKPPEPNHGFMVFYDRRACEDDAWGRARLDFLTAYVVDSDLTPAAAARQACDGRPPEPSDLRIDGLRFQVCKAPDFRGLTNIRFVAIVWPPGDEADGLRQLSFDIYAKRSEIPTYWQRLRRLAAEIHLDYGLCDRMEHHTARP